MTDEIRPCPFCGETAEMRDREDGANYIECTKCGASTNLQYSLKDDARPDLIERWNRRLSSRGDAGTLEAFVIELAGIYGLDENFLRALPVPTLDMWMMLVRDNAKRHESTRITMETFRKELCDLKFGAESALARREAPPDGMVQQIIHDVDCCPEADKKFLENRIRALIMQIVGGYIERAQASWQNERAALRQVLSLAHEWSANFPLQEKVSLADVRASETLYSACEAVSLSTSPVADREAKQEPGGRR